MGMSYKVASRWLRQAIKKAQQGPKKLYIFDFDGTLHRSPPPPAEYEDKEAWWSDPESLKLEDTKPEMWRRETVDAMKAAIAEPDAHVVVMTGRHNSLHDNVEKLLESAGLKPDELITNPEIGNTSRFKQDEMQYLMRQFPNLREIEFWEDRKEDLKGYQRKAEGLGMKFTPHLIKDYSQETPPYIGIFLTPESREELLKRFPPRHEEVRADHVTLKFKPTDEEMASFREKYQLGEEVTFKITGLAEDEQGQALEVELPEEFSSMTNRAPHITVSTTPGVEAVYSNELLERGTKPVSPLTVRGVLDGGAMSSKPPSDAKPPPSEKQKFWDEFLQTKTRNPQYGQPGHHREQVLRKTLYDAGDEARRQIMREWGPYLQHRRRPQA